MRKRDLRIAILSIALTLLLGGCGTSRGGDPPAQTLQESEAAKIFEHYVAEQAAADEALDDVRIAKVESGSLLVESKAAYAMHRLRRTVDKATRYVQPRFFIPVRDGNNPLAFVVLSKKSDAADGKTSTVHYFTQQGESGQWTASGEFFAVTEAKEGVQTTGPAPPGAESRVVRPKKLAPISTDAAGAAKLSPTSDTDRAVCRRFADYLSVTAPSGNTQSPHFTPGSFSGDLVTHYNASDTAYSSSTLRYTPSGDFPVLLLETGAALVACSFRVTDTVTAKTPEGMAFAEGSDEDALLGGGQRAWQRAEFEESVTALIELPPGGQDPATVLACNCYRPRSLSGTGIPVS